MSPMLNDTLTNASSSPPKRHGPVQAVRQWRLTTVKVSAWGTNAPGIDLNVADHLGPAQRFQLCGGWAFATGQPFEGVNSDGLPIGERIAYGEKVQRHPCANPDPESPDQRRFATTATPARRRRRKGRHGGSRRRADADLRRQQADPCGRSARYRSALIPRPPVATAEDPTPDAAVTRQPQRARPIRSQRSW